MLSRHAGVSEASRAGACRRNPERSERTCLGRRRTDGLWSLYFYFSGQPQVL